MMELRPYQSGAIDAFIDYWADGGTSALVDMATGVGKSVIGAETARRLVENGARVGVLTHVRELVAQNAQAMLRCWPQANIGIYSAGLNRRDGRRPITFASIQTVHKRVAELGAWDLLLVDEAHLIPAKGEGMYRRFIDGMLAINPDLRIGGMTATPYRLGEGRLDRGEGRLFDTTVYRYGIADGIRDGYLSPLVSKAGLTEVDVSRVSKSGGEFKAGELERAALNVTVQAVQELVERGADRRSWLVFCAGVDHAHLARDAVRKHGVSCEVVTGETPKGERDRILAAFKAGRIRCLTNANVLTTGFDAPNVDLIGMMRPTLSTSLYVQIVGRGTRLAPGKENCLILDWAGNVRRHGPVDAVVPREPGKRGESDDDDDVGKVAEASVRAKECPLCDELVHIALSTCPVCGHEWPRPAPSHDAQADGDTPILTSERVAPKMLPVITWEAEKHQKAGKPDSMRVTIMAGVAQYPEWIAFEHTGFAGQKARQWWIAHGGSTPFPQTTEEALARFRAGELTPPASINVKPAGRYFEIVGRAHNRRKDAA